MTENVSAKHKGRGSEATKNGKSKAVLSIKAETNGSKMMRLGANVIKTTLKDSNLAQTRNFNHVLNLKIPVGHCHLVNLTFDLASN